MTGDSIPMRNRAMERKLARGECVDVSSCPRTVTGDHVLDGFVEDADYCDAKREDWIWSIGKLLRPLTLVMADNERRDYPAGTFLASTGTRHYSEGRSEAIECVFLR